MDLNEFFDNDHKKQKHSYDHDYRHDEHHTYHQSKHGFDSMPQIMGRITTNPKLVRVIGLAVIVIAIVVIILIIVFFPTIIKLLKFLTDNGLKELILDGSK